MLVGWDACSAQGACSLNSAKAPSTDDRVKGESSEIISDGVDNTDTWGGASGACDSRDTRPDSGGRTCGTCIDTCCDSFGGTCDS